MQTGRTRAAIEGMVETDPILCRREEGARGPEACFAGRGREREVGHPRQAQRAPDRPPPDFSLARIREATRLRRLH